MLQCAADTPGFIQPCLPSPAKTPPAGRTGYTKSSTTAFASWRGGDASGVRHDFGKRFRYVTL